MKKVCVFCGCEPRRKNKEHILPKWLIEYTGDPNRMINLGFNWSSPSEPKFRSFPFNNFTVPACEYCNNHHSRLERRAKAAVVSLFSGTSLDGDSLSLLLDWFDKVRVGLWLADRYLNKDYCGISPKFHIRDRIGAYDRCLFVYRSTDFHDGLNFTAFGTPSFQYSPVSFSLRIKDLIFVNLSSSYLLSRRLGFPFPEKFAWAPQEYFEIDHFLPARERVMLPVLQWPFDPNCIEIYQPIFGGRLLMGDVDALDNFYNNQYVIENSLDYSKGLGKIFLNSQYERIKKVDVPFVLDIPKRYNMANLMAITSKQALDFQSRSLDIPSSSRLPKDERKRIKAQYDVAKRFNRLITEPLITGKKLS